MSNPNHATPKTTTMSNPNHATPFAQMFGWGEATQRVAAPFVQMPTGGLSAAGYAVPGYTLQNVKDDDAKRVAAGGRSLWSSTNQHDSCQVCKRKGCSMCYYSGVIQ